MTDITPAANTSQSTQFMQSVAPDTRVADASIYQSNPFLAGVRGLLAILQTNPVTGMLLVLIALAASAVLYLLLFLVTALVHASAVSVVASIVMFLLWLALIGFASGAYARLGGASIRGEKVVLGTVIDRALQGTLRLSLIVIIMYIVVTIGMILLIVPGVILAARLSLSLIVAMEENLGVLGAMKRSWKLTKGHTWEMLGADFASLIMGTFGLIGPLVAIAPLFGRYKDLLVLEQSGLHKPRVHWLNYLVLAGIVPIILLIVSVFIVAKNLPKTSDEDLTQQQSQQQMEQQMQMQPQSGADSTGSGLDSSGSAGSGSTTYTDPYGQSDGSAGADTVTPPSYSYPLTQ